MSFVCRRHRGSRVRPMKKGTGRQKPDLELATGPAQTTRVGVASLAISTVR